jgi:hypothetical protein
VLDGIKPVCNTERKREHDQDDDDEEEEEGTRYNNRIKVVSDTMMLLSCLKITSILSVES